ncbi:hypothetical protein [Lentzea albidocapillata]|uniref:hypothetical protein n=1 Tax=Lentzea albidocapillata TaxID=40571 RepID=UPI0011823E3E|nr:hypothetical protein [Lentzea albidocapillata]
MSDASRHASLEELESAFVRESAEGNRSAAEIAYALSFRYRNEDVAGERRFDLARAWAIRAIELLDSLPSETLEQVASTTPEIGGVAIPELLHAGVVRERLADVLI